jgi:hypothetical protein
MSGLLARTRHLLIFRSIVGKAIARVEAPMNTQIVANPLWSTASFGQTAETSPMELSALGDHLDLCQGSRGRLFALSCIAETLDSFLAARFVTTVVMVALLMGVASLVI